jgi:hypothetical protein
MRCAESQNGPQKRKKQEEIYIIKSLMFYLLEDWRHFRKLGCPEAEEEIHNLFLTIQLCD